MGIRQTLKLRWGDIGLLNTIAFILFVVCVVVNIYSERWWLAGLWCIGLALLIWVVVLRWRSRRADPAASVDSAPN